MSRPRHRANPITISPPALGGLAASRIWDPERRGRGRLSLGGGLHLEDPSGAHAATDAHADDAVAGAAALHLVEQRRGELGARAAQGGAQGDGAAVDVDLVDVDAELAGAVDRLAGEGLVDLEEVHVPDGQAGLLQRGRDGLGGTDAHDLGVHTDDRVAAEGGEGGEPLGLRGLARHDEGRGRAVGHLRGVAGGGRAILGEDGRSRASPATVESTRTPSSMSTVMSFQVPLL